MRHGVVPHSMRLAMRRYRSNAIGRVKALEVLDHFGQQGIFGGSLNLPHALAVDSKGNIDVGESFDGRRFQRFVYKGMGPPTGRTLPPPKP
jgi:hypothetical protein